MVPASERLLLPVSDLVDGAAADRKVRRRCRLWRAALGDAAWRQQGGSREAAGRHVSGAKYDGLVPGTTAGFTDFATLQTTPVNFANSSGRHAAASPTCPRERYQDTATER